MAKRGQVTIFVVMGVLLVLIIGLGVYYRSLVIENLSELGIARLSAVPNELKPVESYIEECVYETSREAIEAIGSQSGFLELEEDIFFIDNNNLFSNKLGIIRGADLNVPYWYFKAPNGVTEIKVPELNDIESSISSYIQNNLNSCLDNFSSFNGYNFSFNTFRPDTSITDEKVSIILNFPISVSKDEISFNFKRFSVDIDVALGRLYNTAKDILNKELDEAFLEEKALDWMAVYDEIPTTGIDFSCSPKIWTKTKVREDFRDILSRNTAFIKIKDSIHDILDDSNSYYEIDIDSGSGIHASFSYLSSWPFSMEVFPSKGELLVGDQLNELIGNDAVKFISGLFCLNNFHFVYDVKYPVLITLSDDQSFNGAGYDFQFAMLVVIDNNQPRENKLGTLDTAETDKTICENAVSENTVTVVKDIGEFVPVQDASISFKCISTTCDIGRTDSKGRLTARFPACLNGAVEATKPGMHNAKEIVSTNEEGSFTIVMKQYNELSLDIKVIENGIARNPKEGEEIIFQFQDNEDNYYTSIVYPENNIIRLIPGRYIINSYIIENSPFEIKIEGKQIEKCADIPGEGVLGIFGVSNKRCETVTIPATTLDRIVKGGANYEFEIGDEIHDRSIITLYTIADKTPRNYDELNKVYESISTNSLRSDFIYPELT